MIAGADAYLVADQVKEAFQGLRLRRQFKWIVIAVDEENKLFMVEGAEDDKYLSFYALQ